MAAPSRSHSRLSQPRGFISGVAGIQEPKPAPEPYEALAEKARAGFARFWNEELGYCYDVLNGPDGNDPSLQPNQLFAVSLLHSPLTPEQQKGVVDACARHLLTSHGLRSLAPGHPDSKAATAATGGHGTRRTTRARFGAG